MSKKFISLQDWETKLGTVELNKNDMNKLVMNYLVIQGYKDAAEKFAREANIPPNVDLSTIQDRMNVRTAVESGHIDEAIERVNDLDPEVIIFGNF